MAGVLDVMTLLLRAGAIRLVCLFLPVPICEVWLGVGGVGVMAGAVRVVFLPVQICEV